MKFVIAILLISFTVSAKNLKQYYVASPVSTGMYPMFSAYSYLYDPYYYPYYSYYTSYYPSYMYGSYGYYGYRKSESGNEEQVKKEVPKKELTLEEAEKEMKMLKKMIFNDENFSTEEIKKNKRYEGKWLINELKITRALEIQDVLKMMDQKNTKSSRKEEDTKKTEKVVVAARKEEDTKKTEKVVVAARKEEAGTSTPTPAVVKEKAARKEEAGKEANAVVTVESGASQSVINAPLENPSKGIPQRKQEGDSKNNSTANIPSIEKPQTDGEVADAEELRTKSDKNLDDKAMNDLSDSMSKKQIEKEIKAEQTQPMDKKGPIKIENAKEVKVAKVEKATTNPKK